MIRSWMLAILLIGLTTGVTEARGRQRMTRSQGSSWQFQNSRSYPTATTQAAYSTGSGNSSQQVIQTASLSSNSPPSAVSQHPLQAWAEEEARMMASRGTCGHIRPAPPGCFVGVGCGMTCMGSGTLVAEASYQGKMVRVWQR